MKASLICAIMLITAWTSSAAIAAAACCARPTAASDTRQQPAAVVAGAQAVCPLAARADKPTEPGWPLTMMAWTFHRETLFDAIANAKELGVRYIELIPSHAVSSETGDVRLDKNASLAVIAKVKRELELAGIRPLAMYTNDLGEDEAKNRRVFDFAKVMGLTTIVGEPPVESLPLIDRLANEYDINVAIHNHPKPTRYWDPEIVLEAIRDLSPRMGVCADTGHWLRSELDPVECLRKVEGRVHWVHFKDLNEKSRQGHDVVWGTGVGNARAILEELKRQNYTGGISIEYEHNWGQAMPELKGCVEFYRKTVAELFGDEQDR